MFRFVSLRLAMYPAVFAVLILAAMFGHSEAQLPLGRFVEYPVQFTPVATAAAIGNSEQTVTAPGVTLDDIITVNPPAQTALCPTTMARVSALNTVSISFTTLTAVACTPAAGIYKIYATRG